MFRAKVKKTYKYVLPELQKILSEDAQELCEQHGLELKVTDVSRQTALTRLLIRLKGIKSFPAAESSQGDKLQAPLTRAELEKFIRDSGFKKAKPKKESVRQLTMSRTKT